MSKIPMRLLPLLPAILLSATLSACGTREAPRTVSDVSCANYRVISYSVPSRAEREKPREQQADTGNRFDTPETVGEIQQHNARFEAVCPRPPVTP